jgi:hypothetical protein
MVWPERTTQRVAGSHDVWSHGPHQIAAGVLAGAYQITRGLLFRLGHPYRDALTQPKQPRQPVPLASPKRKEVFAPLGVTNIRTFISPDDPTKVAVLMDVPDMGTVQAALEARRWPTHSPGRCAARDAGDVRRAEAVGRQGFAERGGRATRSPIGSSSSSRQVRAGPGRLPENAHVQALWLRSPTRPKKHRFTSRL